VASFRALISIALIGAACAFTGCGDSARGKKDRPPVPITIAVQIGEDEVTASPRQFGAGPITLIASNQTPVGQKLKIDGPRLERELLIDPRDTGSLEVTVEPGDYALTTRTSEQVPPFTLKVGKKRASAQNRLLLP
jgi:hypothetical protein